MLHTSDAAALQSEIGSFYAGFGQPEVLMKAFRDAILVVPLIDSDRVWTSEMGGVHWLCAFTSIDEFARFQVRRGVEPDRSYRYHTLAGWRLADYAASRSVPTGVIVDAMGTAPMAFPPIVAEDGELIAGAGRGQ
jgi:hypothetical protein